MKNIVACFVISIICGQVLAQDLNFGVNFGTNPFNKFKFEHVSDTYNPANTVYVYTAENAGTGEIINTQKLFNTIHFGISARFSRKKLGINIEPQFMFEYNRLRFDSPYANNRILSSRSVRIPIYATYHLFNNPLSLHVNAGIILSSNIIYDYQQPPITFFTTAEPPYSNTINYGDNHFNEVFYDDSQLITQWMLGIGKKIGKLDYNLRYVNNLNSNLKGDRWQIELHINFFFLSKDEVSTKNYLYEE